MKRFDLMHQVNARGTFLVSKACMPHLKKAANPHVLMLSPPLDMKAQWFAPHAAYTMAKYGMSLCVLGMAEEFKDRIAFNALWPRTAIATAAIRNVARRRERVLPIAARRDRGRRRLACLQQAQKLQREFPDRRHIPGREWRARISTSTASIPPRT